MEGHRRVGYVHCRTTPRAALTPSLAATATPSADAGWKVETVRHSSTVAGNLEALERWPFWSPGQLTSNVTCHFCSPIGYVIASLIPADDSSICFLVVVFSPPIRCLLSMSGVRPQSSLFSLASPHSRSGMGVGALRKSLSFSSRCSWKCTAILFVLTSALLAPAVAYLTG